jgi:RNA polymerase sigma-70 factor (ECF subfamily)
VVPQTVSRACRLVREDSETVMPGDGAKERLFDKAVSANMRRIIAIARSYAHGDEQGDLCQEILLQMWKGFDSFEGRSTPSTWIYRVALNTAITFRRNNSRRVEPWARPLDEASPEPTAPASPGNEILILEEFLQSLGKIDRAVFLLYLEDLSYREISEVTGLTESHVGVRISRLKKSFTQRYCGG